MEQTESDLGICLVRCDYAVTEPLNSQSNRIFLILFINSLQEGVANQLLPYVYSDFSLHSLVPITSVISSIIGALVKLPVAKVLDVWGRPQGFGIMVASCTLGKLSAFIS